MKAIVHTGNSVELQNVPKPTNAEPGHLLIKMEACAINPGDKTFIHRPLPLGAASSLYNVYGVSGAGTVIEAGQGVPEIYTNKKVAVYRSLKPSESIVGTWCGYAHVPYLDCAILPDGANTADYSGSLVNIITPYAFLQQIKQNGDKAIISTAGTSATGIAMVGICSAYNFPLISLVRNEKGKQELENLGAENIIVQTDADFKQQLKDLALKLEARAVFDGVGGAILNQIIDVLPTYATIYTYGYLGGEEPFIFHTNILNAKGLSITSFGNFRSETVRDSQRLEKALTEIGEIIHLPHFKTKTGKHFKLEEINEALEFIGEDGEKAVLDLLI